MVQAFFEPLPNGNFAATELTRGPWSDDHQHGGPPAALMGHAAEALFGPDLTVSRMTVEFVRGVPIGELEVRARHGRRGRTVETARVELHCEGREVAHAEALAIRGAKVQLPPLPAEPAFVPGPDSVSEFHFPFFRSKVGYHTAMELRIARGDFGSGPTVAWLRMRHPLIAGSEPSPLERVMAAADSGNGVSFFLDVARYTFVNADLTVHLMRYPEGPWVGLDAVTRVDEGGLGLAEARLHDQRGPIGHGLQSLVVAARR